MAAKDASDGDEVAEMTGVAAAVSLEFFTRRLALLVRSPTNESRSG